MEALRDPYAHVHPLFWPVLWLSLRAFVAWSGKMIEEGHGFAGLSVELTWYGVIRVRALDLSDERAAFHRHMMGVAHEDGWSVLADAAGRVDALLSPHIAHHPREGGDPWVIRATRCAGRNCGQWVPTFAGMMRLTYDSAKGTDPPLATAPLPHSGRGAALAFTRIFRSTARHRRCGRRR